MSDLADGMDDAALRALAARVGEQLLAAGHTLVTAESCTGGWIAKALTDVAGSSRWFEGGFVTYSNAAKIRDLGVSIGALRTDGAVSELVAREMAAGALRLSSADFALAVTGIAGPDGGSTLKPVGTVWFAIARRDGELTEVEARVQHFAGDREAVRRKSVQFALDLL
ncbi:MAG TPA: nicotinamide-nucleotide amidase [Steroidobacteraceae bacterium]